MNSLVFGVCGGVGVLIILGVVVILINNKKNIDKNTKGLYNILA